ncbi:MAG: DedA family protein [Peptococcaceae bacterium]|nr:DedA family protein [Peptococcaceae bacterium]
MDYLFDLIDPVLRLITARIAALGYWGVAIGMAIESCNIPLPSEVILPFGGYLVSTGKLNFFWTAIAGTVGGTAGSIISYLLGLWGGRPFLLRYGRYIGISEKRLAMADHWFYKYGEATVFFTRLMPIIRTFISLPAGISGMNFPRFVIYTFLGSLPWCFFLTYLGVKLGEHWEDLKVWFHRADALMAAVILGTVLYLWYRYKRKG